MPALQAFFKKETVFCVSLLLALFSMLLVRPDPTYLSYPDYRTLALLFCLMLVVAGFQSLGVFARLGRVLLRRARSLRRLSLVFVLLCFFCSMLITNDVTLLTFVPFTILVFRMIGQEAALTRLVVLETIAANLGSMATPIGNPQNLYLYSAFELDAPSFLWAVLPYAGLSLLGLTLLAVFPQRAAPAVGAIPAAPRPEEDAKPLFPALVPFLVLLFLCLLVVFRVLPYGPVLVCVAVAVFLVNRKLYRSVDYFLLLTFLCFFIFIGNLKRIPAVDELLTQLVSGRELWAGILTSQVISNVPAAILLADFSREIPALLTGVNLGGLGTLIASLASLISFQLFARAFPQKKGAYFRTFTLYNVGFLVLLAAAAAVLTRFSP